MTRRKTGPIKMKIHDGLRAVRRGMEWTEAQSPRLLIVAYSALGISGVATVDAYNRAELLDVDAAREALADLAAFSAPKRQAAGTPDACPAKAPKPVLAQPELARRSKPTPEQVERIAAAATDFVFSSANEKPSPARCTWTAIATGNHGVQGGRYDALATCPKCDGTDIGTAYQRVVPDGSRGCMSPCYGHPDGEHIDRNCRRCGFAWWEQCVEPRAAAASSGGTVALDTRKT